MGGSSKVGGGSASATTGLSLPQQERQGAQASQQSPGRGGDPYFVKPEPPNCSVGLTELLKVELEELKRMKSSLDKQEGEWKTQYWEGDHFKVGLTPGQVEQASEEMKFHFQLRCAWKDRADRVRSELDVCNPGPTAGNEAPGSNGAR